jgi:hypothetical protein
VVPHTGSVAAFSNSFLLLWFDKWKTPNVEQQLEGRLDALTLVSEGMTGKINSTAAVHLNQSALLAYTQEAVSKSLDTA